MKTTCYHKIAVKKSLGLEVETRRKINLTELKRKRKPKGEGKSGRKRPRANDYEVIPANPDKVNEKQREYKRVDEAQKDDSVLSKTLEPGEDEDIAGNERPDGPLWLKISGIELRLEEKEILQHRTDWLNDKIMDAAQILMRRQFPYISGFDTVLKAANLSYDPCPTRPFIQIVNRTSRSGTGSHWLTLSTLDCKPGKEVKIYDSAYRVSASTLKNPYAIFFAMVRLL